MSAPTGAATDSSTGRFSPGDRVRVRADWPEAGPRRVHIRTPHYLRGHSGVIERPLGSFPNPETLAFGGSGLPEQPLYQVRFAKRALWPDGSAESDTILADIYEHWLEPVEDRND